MPTIAAARVLTTDGWIGPATIAVDEGRITAIGPTTGAVPERWLAPGSVDVQVNGIDDVDVATADGAAWDRLDALLVAQGVTTWCPTLVTMPLAEYAPPLDRIAAAMHRPATARPTIAGVHLEGPFLGGAPGAHPRSLVTTIDLEWLAALPGHVAVVTLAAEQPLAVAATRLLVERGVLVSIGHTTANEAEFDAVVAAGARLTTHLFNGMSGLHHRDPGVAAFALTNPAVAASLIADGVHVHPRVLLLAFGTLGAGRAVLVTDAVAWRAGSAGPIGIELRDGAPRLRDGTLAGSAITMDAALRVAVSAGVEPADALLAATATPAALLGLHDRGRIAVGCRADLVAYSPDLYIEQVWTAGTPVG